MASPACRRSSCERDEMVFQYSTPATSQSSVTPLLALTANRVELQGVLSSTQSGEGEVDGSGSGIGIRIKKDDRDNTLAKLRELQTVAQALYTTPDPPPLPYIVDHLFFPPRLPENGDSTPTKEFRLLLFVWEVATQFHSGHVMIGPTYKHMQHVVNMLEVMVKLHGPPWPDLQPMGGSHDPAWKHGGMKLPQELLLNELSGMREGDIITLHLKVQNAAVIIRHTGSTITVSSFEVSPKNSQVLATPFRLRCSYPGTMVSIPSNVFQSVHFLEQLTLLLVAMSAELPTNRPYLIGGSITIDYTDTVAPIYITEFLTGLLRGIGSAVNLDAEDGTRICKRIADEVISCRDGSSPWRRSPIWLVIRVALQTSLLSADTGISDAEKHRDYKLLMLYILAKLLQVAIEVNTMPNEKLSHMSRKLSRRAAKLEATGLTIPRSLLEFVAETVNGATSVLANRFEKVQKATVREMDWPPADGLHVARDTTMTMVNSQCYIKEVLCTYQNKIPAPAPAVSFHRSARIWYRPVSDLNLPNLSFLQLDGWERKMALKDIELWVETLLEPFVTANSHRESACRELYDFLTSYSKVAYEEYIRSPVDSSLMLLTVIELWVAIDQIATSIIPLLKHYPSGFEVILNFLSVLLLPTGAHLRRLHKVEAYMQTRRFHATGPTIFQDGEKLTQDSFPVRYFDQSPLHQSLHDKIIRDFIEQLKEKITCKRLKGQYDVLLERALNVCICLYSTDEGEEGPCPCSELPRTRHLMHSDSCSQCAWTSTNLPQWPLPRNGLVAKAIVFELDLPPVFAAWRDATYQMLLNPFTPWILPAHAPINFCDEVNALAQYFCRRSKMLYYDLERRVPDDAWLPLNATQSPTAASPEAIPQDLPDSPASIPQDSPDSLASIPQFWSNTSVANFEVWPEVQYRLAITEKLGIVHIANALPGAILAATPLHLEEVTRRCTFQLPIASAALQYALDSTNHTPNYIISNQPSCPAGWTLYDFYAFTTLRAGVRLQWLNILREIRAANLYLNRLESTYLFQQTIWQAGPQGTGTYNKYLRGTHEILSDQNFCSPMLSALEDSLATLKKNWLQNVSIQILISLGARILSLAPSGQSKSRAAHFLRACRAVCMEWMLDIFHHIHSSSSEDDAGREKWQHLALTVAVTCRLTYDVDHDVLYSLFNSERDLADFIECAVFINNTTPQDISSDELSDLLNRDARLAHGMEPVLRDLLSTNNGWFHAAVFRILPQYVTRESWRVLNAPNDSWITARSGGDLAIDVHYNLLQGKLLVDGTPLSNLPKVYREDPLYTRLFQKRTFLVATTDMPGMQFQTVHSVFAGNSAFKIYFGKRNTELVIRTKRGSSIHEIIPHGKLAGDFPETMLKPYAHFLDLEQQTLEFRPLDNEQSLWTASPKNWLISISQYTNSKLWSAHGRCTLPEGERRLIDYRSPIQNAIWRVFQSIEKPSNIEITLSIDERVTVRLPRYKLDFGFDGTQIRGGEAQISCLNFPGMVIDVRPRVGQDMRALYGLQTYLVLRDAESRLPETGRTVIIPYGEVFYAASQHHTTVRIDSDAEVVAYQLYTIDTLLGRLVPDWSTKSLLFKAYLHALTSYCLPDPLTGLTGTEQALDDMRSARAHSFQKLDTETTRGPSTLQLLHKIFKLTPARCYFARQPMYGFGYMSQTDISSKSLQLIYWQAALPSFCQHGQFCSIARSILQYWETAAALQHVQFDLTFLADRQRDEHLHRRASIREAAYQPTEYGGCLHSRQEDHIYQPRNFSDQQQHFEARVCRVSRLTNLWITNLQPTSVLMYTFDESELFAARRIEIVGYDHDLHRLGDPLTRYWFSLYEFCRNCSRGWDKYKLLFILSSLAYSGESKAPMILIETILAFATNAVFSTIPAPRCPASVPGFEHESSTMARVQAELDIIRARSQGNTLKPIEQYTINQHYPPLPVISIVHDLSGLKRALAAVKLLTNTVEPKIHLAPTSQARPHATTTSDDPLKLLLARFSSNANLGFHHYYTHDLEQSWEALHKHACSFETQLQTSIPPLESAELYLRQCMEHMRGIFDQAVAALHPEGYTTNELLYTTGLQPRITAQSLLRLLSLCNRDNTEEAQRSKEVIVSFGKSVSLYQQATRMYCHIRRQDLAEFTKEWVNKGHEDWDPLEYPEWLLFEIENNILIRPVQAKIAAEMISPCSGRSSLMQVNMGEGKSSVIVPIVAVALANREQLVRVVVPKPLSSQMFNLLVQKLGGLLNRRIYYLPFSRQAKSALGLHVKSHRQTLNLFKECMANGGILVVQPEHLMSFKLMGIESLFSSDDLTLLESQRWLDQHARDILDESDELLHVRYELIYSTGIEQSLELGSKRWVMIQEIFSLVRKHIRVLKEHYTHGIELIERYDALGSFPFVRLLEKDAEEELVARIAEDLIQRNFMKWVSMGYFTNQLRSLVLCFIRDKDMREEELSKLTEIPPFLLLLRGLLAHGILSFVLQEKRWRVDYGLRGKPYKSHVAVPYRAKDTPAPRAKFSHPDITIALTCLSYYYQGVSESQLRLCFQELDHLTDSGAEYQSWIKGCKETLPPHLWHLNAINLEDNYQWSHTIYPVLKFSKGVIDFYLAVMVFPHECKEFSHKLTASGWDLAEEKTHLTTGFSGTNDNRYLLPTSIEQVELVDHAHTSAKVLSYLLQPENNFYTCAEATAVHGAERLSAREFLQKLVDEERSIQVLLDVGAQLLDMNNEQVALYWLTLATNRNQLWTAALFFNDRDELMVMEKDGSVHPYFTSMYARNMTTCLLYLDEGHTRGTDIKLPNASTAAVTLGPKLTKDKLVQACMRMRNLGHGQSVSFFAPPEVHHKVLKHCNKIGSSLPIETIDILSWVMHETCIQTQQSLSLWAHRGIGHQTRQKAWRMYLCNEIDGNRLATTWKEPAAKTLTELYSTSNRSRDSLTHVIAQKLQDPELRPWYMQLQEIKSRCEEYQATSLQEVTLQEEQEREVEREIQREFEHTSWKPQPPTLEPYSHKVEQALVHFIRTGIVPPLPRNSGGSPFLTLMDTLDQTSLSHLIEREPWTNNILTTTDFSRTVKIHQSDRSTGDWSLRPVTWLISTSFIFKDSITLILLSPFEVNELLPDIRASQFVNLHMYSAQVQASAPNFDSLTYATIPALQDNWENRFGSQRDALMTQVNLYAGGVFFRNYETYRRTCEFLGIFGRDGGPKGVKPYGLLARRKNLWEQDTPKVGGVASLTRGGFQKSPFEFLRRLAEVRREGVEIGQTHLGFLLQSRELQREDFEAEEEDKERQKKRKKGVEWDALEAERRKRKRKEGYVEADYEEDPEEEG